MARRYLRSTRLADATACYAEDERLKPLAEAGLSGHSTGQRLSNGYRGSTDGAPGAFPQLANKGGDAQTTIEDAPDEHWIWTRGDPPILRKAGHCLFTARQRTSTGRSTAVATDIAYSTDPAEVVSFDLTNTRFASL